jgi:hypothetical protein
MIKILLLLMPLYLFAISNPYKDFDVHEKLNVMINYFLNEALKETKPPEPVKRIIKDDGATLDPVKYELYFNYIQRLKAIKESRAEEQKAINVEYAGKIGFYNGKLKSLRNYYSKKENLYALLQESINKGFKIVYGKPTFTNIEYNSEINLLKANLRAIDMYDVETFPSKEIELFVYEGHRNNFIENSDKAEIIVRFNYDGEYLTYKDVLFHFEQDDYIGTFINPSNEKIKLNIKINDDIFRPLEVGEQ